MTTFRRAANLMEADVGDDLVALDPDAGTCFGFNSVATTVWRQLEQPKTFDELKAALLGEYDVDPELCTVELKELLDSMSSQGLVTVSG